MPGAPQRFSARVVTPIRFLVNSPLSSIRRTVSASLIVLCVVDIAAAGTIDTAFIEQPWPKQRMRETEVGRYPLRWRQRASKRDGIFAGVRFQAPRDRQAVWTMANEYDDIGTITPGVTAVRYLERTPERQVIQLDMKVLWKTLTLTFEVEQDPPKTIRFRWADRRFGEYRGVCVFQEAPPSAENAAAATDVELSTWLKPSRPVPMGLLLTVERMTLLRAAREFLEACESHQEASPRR